MTNPAPTKASIRAEMRRRLRQTNAADGDPVREAVARWLARRPAPCVIAAFAALPGEIDLLPLLPRFPQHRWALPRVDGDDLVFHEVRQPSADLASGAFGIREPLPTLPVVPPDGIAIFLCPGLAFDPAGGRLGKGRGFYDRTLARAGAGAVFAGVCFPCQRVPDICGDERDIPMHLVIDGTDS